MRLTRRDAIRLLATAPLVAAGGCCTNKYPTPLITGALAQFGPVAPILMPKRRSGPPPTTSPVIDVHAHFFNGSDVPVKGFVAECLGHKAPRFLHRLLEALGWLAEKLAERAPTALDELRSLRDLVADAQGRSEAEIRQRVDEWFRREAEAAADRVVEVVRDSEFERRYREMNPPGPGRGSSPITQQEVLEVARAARQPAPQVPAGVPRTQQQIEAEAARAKLEFVFYMLSKRAANLKAYIDGYAPENGSFGVDTVLGSLVDFDYWLDCPPRSAHDDQVALHQYLATLHGGFMRPVVAYNPWTDIAQNGAGLHRVLQAWTTRKFVGVKIYPPTGFMPAANATSSANTSKRRPDLQRLDDVLASFFKTCADSNIPIISHAARSNGRDRAHDEFGGPAAWELLLCRFASEAAMPILDFGHFGGDDSDTAWTQEFANLMKNHSTARLFGDLGYWDQLMCDDAGKCDQTRRRLKAALSVRIGSGETVADRVMFATDWLMFSQVKGWRDYPIRVRDALRAIAPNDVVDRIFGLNAKKFFSLVATDSMSRA